MEKASQSRKPWLGTADLPSVVVVAVGFFAVMEPVAAADVLVESGSSMRYLANASDPEIGLGWTAENFDDSSWSEGVYSVGYESGLDLLSPERSRGQKFLQTTVPAGISSVYTRATFTVADVSVVKSLFLGADYDDGYIAWINGVEVLRSPEMPAGKPSWNATPEGHESSNGRGAVAPYCEPSWDISRRGVPALHDGENVLAIAAWDESPTSRDLVLAPRLVMNPSTSQWEKAFGRKARNEGHSVQQTSDGGYIVAGWTEPVSFSFGAGNRDDSRDVYLIKTGPAGNVLWERTFGGKGHDSGSCVQQTRDGGYIVTGSTTSADARQDVLSEPPALGSSPRRYQDIYLVKTDGQGNLLWEKTYGGEKGDSGSFVQETADGGYIVAGSTAVPFGRGRFNTQLFLLKADRNGERIWQKNFEGQRAVRESGNWVGHTRDGGYILIGSYKQNKLIKTDESGNLLWERQIVGGPGASAGRSGATFGHPTAPLSAVHPTRDGGYIVAASIMIPGAGPSDLRLIKTGSNGDRLWERAFGGEGEDQASSVLETRDGGYIVVGSTHSFGDGRRAGRRAYVVKTDENGNLLWDETFGESVTDYQGRAVQQTRDGGYIIAGNKASAVYLIKLAPRKAFSGGAEVIGYRGDLYFKTVMPRDELHAQESPIKESMPCQVRAGDAFQVYLVPAYRSSVPVPTPRRDALTEEEQSELTRVQEELAKQRQELSALETRASGFRKELNDQSLSEKDRDEKRQELKNLATEMRAIRDRSNNAQRTFMELRGKRAVAMRSLASSPPRRMITSFVMVGRLRKPGPVRISVPDSLSRTPDLVVDKDLHAPPEFLEKPPTWLKDWAKAHFLYRRRSGADPEYFEFLRERLEERFHVPPRTTNRPRLGRAPGNVQLYDIFTGSAAIRESMQLDRLLEFTSSGKREINIAEVQALELKDHPFDDMRKGRSFTGSDLAKICPADVIYLRISSLAEWFRFKDLTNRWGGSFLSTVQVQGRDYDTFDRYTHQLALGDELMVRLVGTHIVGEFAVVATDPLFIEGTAVAVLFASKKGEEEAFHSLFDTQREVKALAVKGARREKLTPGGASVDFLSTPDWRVRSYALTLGTYRVFSNSPELVSRIVRVSQGEAKSLFDAPDYRFYRSRYPLDRAESGFLLLSQDWFRRIMGPSWRIGHGRRRAAAHLMKDIRFAWQTALLEGGRADLEGLIEAGFPPEEVTSRLQLSLDPRTAGVASEEFGYLSRLRPVDELSPETVSQHEKELYDRLRAAYTSYWRQFIDPVGVRFETSDEELEADTLILPLIENSIYTGLRELAGGAVDEKGRVAPLPDDTLGSVTVRWSPERAGLDRFLGRITQKSMRSRVSFDPAWFGRTLTVGVTDGDLFLTVNSNVAEMFMRGSRLGEIEALVFAALFSSLTLPVFAAVEVEEPVAVEKFLEGVFKSVGSERRGRFSTQVVHYETPGTPPVHTITLTFLLVDFRIHYTFVNGWMILATRPDLLERWYAKVSGAGEGEEAFGNSGRLILRPDAFRMAARTVSIVWQERILKACHANLAPLQRAADAGRFDRADEFLGCRAFCPNGGEYILEGGWVRCTEHGIWNAAKQPLSPSEDAPAVRLVNEMKDVTVDFRFTDDGLRSRLRVRFKAQKR